MRRRRDASVFVRVVATVLMQALITLVFAGWIIAAAGGDLSIILPTP